MGFTTEIMMEKAISFFSLLLGLLQTLPTFRPCVLAFFRFVGGRHYYDSSKRPNPQAETSGL